MRDAIKDASVKRLNRIEGQVRGLSKMVNEDRYCIDIVTQIAAVRSALRRLEEEILRDHVGHCVEHAVASGNNFATYNSTPGLAYPAVNPDVVSVGATWAGNYGSVSFFAIVKTWPFFGDV